MNRAEKSCSLLVFGIILGATLFFSALVYMNTYHFTEQRIDVTVWQSDGVYGADRIVQLIDTYPYIDNKTVLNREVTSFTNQSWMPVITWAMDNSDDDTVYLQSNAIPFNVTGKFTFPSGTYILGDIP